MDVYLGYGTLRDIRTKRGADGDTNRIPFFVSVHTAPGKIMHLHVKIASAKEIWYCDASN